MRVVNDYLRYAQSADSIAREAWRELSKHRAVTEEDFRVLFGCIFDDLLREARP